MNSKIKNSLFRILQIPYKFLPKPMCNLIWDISLISDALLAVVYRRLYINKYAKKAGSKIHIGKYVVIKKYSKFKYWQ